MRRHLVPQLLLPAIALSAAAVPASADQLTVNISGIERVRGALMLAVYSSAETWAKNGNNVAARRVAVTGKTATVIFEGLTPGAHAVKLYHDENDNGELDSNMLGIPSESYGFSNNGGRFGPPDFEDARFSVNGDTSIDIRLR